MITDRLLYPLGIDLSRAFCPLIAQGQQELLPLFKVKAVMVIVLLLVVLLMLFAFNRLMARWARGRANERWSKPKSTYVDDEDWTARSLYEGDSTDDDFDSADDD